MMKWADAAYFKLLKRSHVYKNEKKKQVYAQNKSRLVKI